MLVIRRRGKQPARLAQRDADRPVGRVEFGVDDTALTAEPEPVGAIFAVAFDREDRIDTVRLAQVEIVLAMVRRHMDEPGAAVGRDEIASEHRARLGKEATELVHRMANDGAG